MNKKFSRSILFAVVLFGVLIGTMGQAMAYSTPGDYEVVFWWDTDGDLSTTETSIDLDAGDDLTASLYVSGINADYEWTSYEATLTWDDAAFGSETVSIDYSGGIWDSRLVDGITSEAGTWVLDGQGTRFGVLAGGDDIKLLDVTFTDFSGTATTLASTGDGYTTMYQDWSAQVSVPWPAGASFEGMDLIIGDTTTTTPDAPTIDEVTTPTNTTPQTLTGTKDAGTSIHLAADDAEIVASNEATTWSYDAPLSEGSNTIKVFARDGSGNDSDKTTVKIVLDSQAPVITRTLDPGTYDEDQSVELSVDVDEDTLYAELLTSDPGDDPDMPTSVYSGAFDLPVDGDMVKYWLVYGATDEAGNQTGPTVAAYTIDTRAIFTEAEFSPTPNDVDEDDDTYHHNAALTLTLTSTGNTIYYASAQNEVDDPDTGSSSFNGSGTINLNAGSNAERHYVVKYFAHDADLDTSEGMVTLNVYVDTDVPNAPVISAGTGTVTDSTPTLSGTKEADTAIRLVDGDTIVAMSAAETWNYTPADALADGQHSLTFAALDRAGNESAASEAAVVTVDTQAPALSAQDPACDATDQALNQSITATITDAGTGIDTNGVGMTVTVDGTAMDTDDYEIAIDDADPNAVAVIFTLNDGTLFPRQSEVNWSISAADLAGNALATNSCTFTTSAGVAISPANIGLVAGQTYKVGAGGGSKPYTWTILDPDGSPLAEDVEGNSYSFTAPATIGSYTVEVTDDNGATDTATIEVIKAIAVSGQAVLHADTTVKFTASGGKQDGEVVWDASAGSINADTGRFTAPTVATGSTTVTITAFDATYDSGHATPVSASMDVAVYPAMEISNAPEDTVVVESGQTCDTEFKAKGGSGDYEWNVTAPDGTTSLSATGRRFEFTAPDQGAFAGLYTIALADAQNTDYSSSFQVYVPMRVSPTTDTVGDNETWIVRVLGAPEETIPTGSVLDDGGEDGSDGYGTLNDGEEESAGVATFVYTPADVDAATGFKLSFSVADWADTPVETVTTDLCWMVPMMAELEGLVTRADGETPIEGATVTPVNTDLPVLITSEDGGFELDGLQDTGLTYRFCIEADDYVSRVVDHTEIDSATPIALDAVGDNDGIIDGTVGFQDDPDFTQATVARVRVQNADGDWVQDGSGNVIEAMPDPVDGSYRFVIPEAEMDGGAYKAVADADGYVTATKTDIEVSTNTATVNLQLAPVTRIHVNSQSVDVDSDDVFDQVEVSFSATAGLDGDGFDGTAAEIGVTDAVSDAIAALLYDDNDNTWTYSHASYETFSLDVLADISNSVRDVDAGYAAALTWAYVPSATNATETVISDIGKGSTLVSDSGDTQVVLPPGGVTGDAGRQLTLSVVEADPAVAGTNGDSASVLLVIELVDANGDPVADDEINELLVTMSFDETVTESQLLTDPEFVIYYAATLADLVEGNYSGSVSVDDIVDITQDDTGSWVTFRVDHLTAFGVLAADSNNNDDDDDDTTPGSSDGDSSCFIGTIGGPGQTSMGLGLLAVFGLLTAGRAVAIRMTR